jgi:hypothetical protein
MRRVLTPSERISEVLFGLIMVLTFTGSLSVAEAGREDVRMMLIGALGCNVAWGIVDAILYLMGSLAVTGTNLRTYRAVRGATDPHEAAEIIAGALPPLVAAVLQPAEIESLRQRLLQLPEPPTRARLDGGDLVGAFAVFLLVFGSTFPVAVPFLVMDDVVTAKRTSDGVAIALLFAAGFAYGRSIRGQAWLFGIVMVVLGVVLVTLTIALGG